MRRQAEVWWTRRSPGRFDKAQVLSNMDNLSHVRLHELGFESNWAEDEQIRRSTDGGEDHAEGRGAQAAQRPWRGNAAAGRDYRGGNLGSGCARTGCSFFP